MQKAHNFYAGPAIVPQEVLQELANGIIDYKGKGLSIAEISHRSQDFTEIIQSARQMVRELLNLPPNYEVLFLSGGSTTQFSLVPMNLMPHNQKVGYINTGNWANKAIKAAQEVGGVQVLASSEDKNYRYIPRNYEIPNDLAYLYFCSNNTIYGTQFQDFPDTDVPLVGDMCSDIFSREFDISKFDLIHASAQKNMGIAGITLVVVNTDKLGKTGRKIPTIFDYQSHLKKDSVLNTAAVVPVYGAYLTLQWIKKQGLKNIEERNHQKAALLYDFIDKSSLFTAPVSPSDRSIMNVIFTTEPQYETSFLQFAEKNGIHGLKGYRTVGGFRASLYNALNIESVEFLVEVMKDFEQKNL